MYERNAQRPLTTVEPRRGDRVLTPTGAIAKVIDTHLGGREVTVEWPDGAQARFRASRLTLVVVA